ncbi:ATP-binding cassette [Capsaspora owczarzaki ATCC 30864]|uniref:ATP-binding cassette n=1 Tax=Capsaspora owczarzaki (strain ATCC 30864) TaxID=595528 RepID=UPI0001FE2F27|nr:ATP-binding cassette [Capsaspora owczarzaki ATCC 30864]|eukprot:XP_004347341.1 ATP-binding cassette [Capsaspora owczarzaki ATCC 30864]
MSAAAAAAEGHCLAFRNVSYSVQVKHSRSPFAPVVHKDILMHSHGLVEAGQTMAILGSSGSGKTSLLDVLACRNIGGTVTGDIYLNGARVTSELIQDVAGYVMQDDRLLPNLTVTETLFYIAALKLPSSMTDADKMERVNSVIAELGLRHVAGNRVGGNTRGLSGGERRRVSIGVQMILDPSVLFLDEPTSGLDAFTATAIVKTLSQLARRNRTVIFTIHQPRSDICQLFDQVMLMSKGYTVYTGSAQNMLPYFSTLGFECPEYSNPLDYFLDTITVDDRSQQTFDISFAILQSLVGCYERSATYTELQTKLGQVAQIAEAATQRQVLNRASESCLPQLNVNSTPASSEATPLLGAQKAAVEQPAQQHRGVSGKRASYLSIVKTLTGRATVNLRRDADGLNARLTQQLLFGVLIFIFVFRLKTDQPSVQNRTGFLYEAISGPVFIGMLNAMALFPTQRDVFYRESRDGLYGASAFLLSYTLHALWTDVTAILLFSGFSYWAVGLYSSFARFCIFTTVMYFLQLFGESLGLLTLSFFYETTVANQAASLIISASALVASGFLRSTQSIPVFLQYMGYATLHKYASEVMVANEYQGLQLECPANLPPSACEYQNGEQYIDEMFPGAVEHLWRNIGIIAGFATALRILPYFFLKFVQRSLR